MFPSHDYKPEKPAVIKSGVAAKGELEVVYLDRIQAHYKEMYAEYSKILEEYDSACNRACNSRRKSHFPMKSTWNPPGRLLSTSERYLLLGPSSDVVLYNKLVVFDNNTNRMIVNRHIFSKPKFLHHLCASAVIVWQLPALHLCSHTHLSIPRLGRTGII